MKEAYQSPTIEIIDLAAMEQIAALDGHPDEGIQTAGENGGDIFNPSFGVVSRPGA